MPGPARHPLARAAWALLLVLATAPAVRAEFADFSAYGRLLQRHVSPGETHGIRLHRVDYRAWAADPDHARAVASLAAFDPARLATRAERLAFWINAYNLLAVKTVIDTGVTGSIKDAGGLFRPVWERDAGVAGGRGVSLDQVEHKVLRPMGEPRIHLAIVCASLSCPDLRPEPYVPDTLDAQLDDAARNFLGNPTKGLAVRGNGVTVSRIFDWFEGDFGGEAGVLRFVGGYVALPGRARIDGYFPYDWALNGR